MSSVDAFLQAAANDDAERALEIAAAEPGLAASSLHVAAVLGLDDEVRRLARDRDAVVAANPTDGESVFHAAERFHEDALELLLEFGVDLNASGDWGNTPLYFLLRYWDIAEGPPELSRGLHWLLDHGADPNVVCGREQETSLHVAARRGQSADVVRLLLDRGADVGARRGDGRSAWVLARRGGYDELADLLEAAGAEPEELTPTDRLMAACGHGDAEAARRLAASASPEPEDLRVLPDAASRGRSAVVMACLAAGFPLDTAGESGATALHYASIHGDAAAVRELLRMGADVTVVDPEHHATPLGWAEFGREMRIEPGGDYDACVLALVGAGAQ